MGSILFYKDKQGNKIPIEHLNENQTDQILSINFRDSKTTVIKQKTNKLSDGLDDGTTGRYMDMVYKQKTLYLLVKDTVFLVKGN